jgi:3-ketosteroid 9alpha-monooxygenase subunit B
LQSIDQPVEGQHVEAPLRAVVRGIVQETADTRSFLLELPPACSAYQAGQHLSIMVALGDSMLTRSYSFSSAPEVDAIPTLTVRRVTGGKVSTWLHEQLAIGSVLQTRRPAGQFTLSEEATAPLLLIGAGSGITPLMSLAKAALARTCRPVRLFYANPSIASTVFKRQLEVLAKQHAGRFALRYHIDERDGLPDERVFAQQFQDYEPADVYVCGPRPFMQLAERVTSRTAPEATLHIEHFEAAVTSPVARQATPPSAMSARIRWRIAGTPVTFQSQPGQTLLEAARAAGHDPPTSCEEGYCGSCAVRLVVGRVKMNVTDGLNAGKLARGWVLPCQAQPLTSEIELEP